MPVNSSHGQSFATMETPEPPPLCVPVGEPLLIAPLKVMQPPPNASQAMPCAGLFGLTTIIPAEILQLIVVRAFAVLMRTIELTL